MKIITVVWFALLFAAPAFSQTKMEIRPDDLPRGITGYIAKNFAGFGVDKAFKIDNKGILSTRVMISKGSESLALTFDKDLKLVRKETMKPDAKPVTLKEEKKNTPSSGTGHNAIPEKKYQ
jgi:hypothetical protein